MGRVVPASLAFCGQWNDAAPALDQDIILINDCRFGSDVLDDLPWSYALFGESIVGDDQGTVANMTAVGTKWGLPACVDLSNVGENRWTSRDFSGSFGHPGDMRIMTIGAWVKPTYSGTPSGAVAFLGPGGQGWGAGTYNAGSLYHAKTDGKLKYVQWSSTHGATIGTTASSSAWSPTAGQWYFLEICHDYLNGNQYLFVDGVLVGTSSHTGSISTSQRNYFIVGAPDEAGYMGAEGPFVTSHYVQEITISNGLRNTSGYTVDDRPMLEKLNTPFRVGFARDLSVGDEYKLAPLPRGNWLHTDVGIDTVAQKFGGGALKAINPPAFPAMRYSGSDLISGIGNIGTAEFWFKQGGSPPFSDEQTIFQILQGNPWNSSNTNKIEVYQETDGDLYFQVYGQANSIMDQVVATNPFTTGVWHHVQLSWQGYGNGLVPCSGGCRFLCFIDGVNTHDGTGAYWGNTRTPGAETVSIGDNSFANRGYSNFTIDELCFYDVILNTANFTPPTEEYDFDPPLEAVLQAFSVSEAAPDVFGASPMIAGTQA